MESDDRALLGVVDYLIFSAMLLVSAGIGVYFRFSGGKQKTTEEYLLAGKDMSIVPVAFSLMASFLSAITVIGIPAEMYRFGLPMAWLNVAYVFGICLSMYLSLPVFFELQASTAYEYIERRFGKWARTLTSLAFVFQMILYMSVVLYAPALALSAVTNMSVWLSVVSIGVVCTFYCTLGGMKAVLWTDVFQALLMYIGIFAVLIKGFLDIGFFEVFKIANDNGRINIPGFELDASTRYTFYNVLLQGMVLSMSSFSANQVQVQRLLTVKNLAKSRQALILSIPMGVSFHLLNCVAGLVIYAYFSKCDPMTSPSNPISSADQLLPYYMMKALGAYPGLPGLCICGVFSASLSTVSSAVNSLTAVTMQDLIKPFLEMRGLSQKNTAFAAKAITLFYGFLCVMLTFLVATFGNLVQSSLTVFGMLGGPVLALFLLGMLTRRANEKGAVIGLILGISFAAWISFGSSANALPPKDLPISLEGCEVNGTLWNISDASTTQLTSTSPFVLSTPSEFLNINASLVEEPESDIFPLYTLSYMWFAPIGLGSTFVLGYTASLIISAITGEKKEVPDELLSPLVKWKWNKTMNVEENEKNMKISEGPMELQNVNGKSISESCDTKFKEKEKF